MNKETRLILRALYNIQRNQITLVELIKDPSSNLNLGLTLDEIDQALNPPTNNLEEQRAKEIKDEN